MTEPKHDQACAASVTLTIRQIDGWTLARRDGDDDLLISELDLGHGLRYARPDSIIQTIDRLVAARKFNESEFLHTPWEKKVGQGRPRKNDNGGMRWLTEEQALLVATQSDTPVAWELTRDMARVFRLARRGLLPQQAPAADLAARDVMVAMASEVVGQMVAPLLKQFSQLGKALAQRGEGMITPQQATDLKRDIGSVARDYYELGDYETMKAAKSAVHQYVMAASEWGGTGRVRWAMPAGRYAVAVATLRALRTSAERRLRRAKKTHATPRRQLTLPVDKPN